MDIPGSQAGPEQREEELHRQMRGAAEAYRHAAEEHNRLLRATLSRDWRPDADGHQALYRAATVEHDALRTYVDVLSALKEAVTGLKPKSEPSPETPGLGSKRLTARELEVVKLIAIGLSSREISAQLNISFKTVVVHRYNIMRKLGVHDVVSLVRQAVRKKLVKL